MIGSSFTARACANIALVKYWGKRDATLNLPARGSLSLTLDALTTVTTVRFDASLASDALRINHAPVAAAVLARTSAWLDHVRALAGTDARATIDTENFFPTASGLASSASGFAALALAAARAAGLDLAPTVLSRLARLGSGSAARSIYGGLVRMHAGARDDGDDAIATPIDADAAFVDELRMVIAEVGGGAPKTHGSRDAMEHCAATSPLYAGWIACVDDDLRAAEAAIAARDLEALGAVTEGSALAMHAAAIASRPTVLYWQPPTLAALAEVRALRGRGVGAWATMDAGPHVKVLTRAADSAAVAAAVAAVPGITAVTTSAPGTGATLT